MGQPPGRTHAIVIGGSIAGLFAARVLSEFFDRVTILDRDELEDAPVQRKGVPQGPQIHAILTPSYEAVKELFPGLLDELLADGASAYDSGTGMVVKLNGCWIKPGRCDLYQIDCTRPFYEAKIRSRVRSLSNVVLLPRKTVRALIPGERGAIVGVECEDLGINEHCRIDGDFVVDASGRATHAPRWLDALGYGLPATDEVKVDMTYVGALYRPAPDFRPRAKMHVIHPNPPAGWHGGSLQPVEGGMWRVSQWGMFGDRPVLDDASFLEFSQTLASKEIHAFLCDAQRVSDLKSMGVPASQWHRYDRMKRFPPNFCSIGDAVSSVNPIYGQGMTKAAIHAMHLRELFRDGLATARIAERMRQDLPAVVEKLAWMITVYGDLVYPQAVGRRPADFRFVTWYTRCIAELASTDLGARKAYQSAVYLMGGMYSLFRPNTFLKVLAYAARRPFVPLERRVNTGPMPQFDGSGPLSVRR